ncbi:MAG TPA: thioredoxin domain-containing protein [Candidatus Saccharimonadales bacterium]|jgi:protein-disulfide isomerase|nr:thioredoxin domain-containing protein [Candidatus Saccharimonadales bacterium]
MKSQLKFLIALFAFLYSVSALAADGSSLKPPPGIKVAIVMFEDLECPDCARAYPVVWDAATAHKIPVLLHDFPLPKHFWSFDAAVFARYFDTKSQKLGDDFRGYIFKSQVNITAKNLHQFVQRFADDNKVPLPFVVDPEGKLKAKVKADYDLGVRINLDHTPTIFVVGSGGGSSTPFVEVTDRTQLAQIIEDMQKKSGASAAPAPVKRPAGKTAAKKKTS